MSCTPYDLLLWELALQGFLHRNRGICSSGHTHRLIDIGSSREGIPDRTSKAGSSPTEGFDLRGMVVGFILEIHQPFLGLSVNLHRHNDAAGVDLFGFLLVVQLAFFFQLPHRHQRQVHQTDEFILPAPEDLAVVFQVLLVRLLQRFAVISVLEADIL